LEVFKQLPGTKFTSPQHPILFNYNTKNQLALQQTCSTTSALYKCPSVPQVSDSTESTTHNLIPLSALKTKPPPYTKRKTTNPLQNGYLENETQILCVPHPSQEPSLSHDPAFFRNFEMYDIPV
jgi:hypothetical protein